MIIGWVKEMEIGKRYCDLIHDSIGAPHDNTPFVILREATFDEWLTCLEEYGVDITPWMNVKLPFYYEVSID